jgi:transcriptional regulator with XRE-family HTH domain
VTATGVGEFVRDWRTRHRRSQMDLALEVGVSARHLSFVETGRSKPSPELVLAIADRLEVWKVVLANAAAGALTATLPPHLLGPPLNVYGICLHPEGLAARTLNFPEWADYLVRQLRRSIVLTGDGELAVELFFPADDQSDLILRNPLPPRAG